MKKSRFTEAQIVFALGQEESWTLPTAYGQLCMRTPAERSVPKSR